MPAKTYTVTKKINGKEYVAQFNGMSAALEAQDNTYIDGTSTPSAMKYNKYVLDNVIVSPPGLTVDDFETIDELNEVIAFGRDVMGGKFRDKKDKATA